MSNLATDWKNYFQAKSNRVLFSASLVIVVIVLLLLPRFLVNIEFRNGFAFSDPILSLFDPLNLTWLTFGLIYAAVFSGLFHFGKNPQLLQLAFLSYAFTASLRMIAMYTLPLNPPETMIMLNDPFVQFFGSGDILTKDLFFSGHTSTMFLLYLITESKKLKMVFLLGTILVAICVLLQHVHYTVDVIAAPFFAYGAYVIAVKSSQTFKKISN